MVAVLVAIAAPARADDRAVAEGFFRSGAKAYSAQSFETAALEFEQAYVVLPLPEIAFSAAQAYRRAYRVAQKPQFVRRAVELYKIYLTKVKAGGRVGDAADGLGEMERELDRLKASGVQVVAAAQPVKTQLGISVNVARAADHRDAGALQEVGDAPHETIKGLVAMIDGKAIEPFELADVEAKPHTISVRADGYFPVDKQALAVEGQASLVEVELVPMPGTLVIRTESDAHLAIDGRAVAGAAWLPFDVAAGTHLLAVTRDGREPFGREVTVKRGERLAIDAPLAKTGRRRAVPYLLGAAGALAAGTITSGIVALVYDGRASDLRGQIAGGNRPPSDGDRYTSEVSTRDHFATATWALGGAAVAAAAVAGSLYFFDHPSADGVRLAPVVSESGAGAVVMGQF